MISWPASAGEDLARPPRARRLTAASAGEPRDEPSHRFELDTAASRWQRALDATERALGSELFALPPAELQLRRHELVLERRQTAALLARSARVAGVEAMPWLSPVPVTPALLGLPAGTRACLFDVEGVLTDGGLLHAWAWGEVFDELLLRLSTLLGWQFVPFDRDADYRAYVEGRSRVEGINAFLASRGLHLPDGRLDDPVTADTASGLAKRKGEAVVRGLRKRGVTALLGARRYLEAAGHAGLGRAVISASTSTLPMLELAGLSTLVEERVDAEVIRSAGLRTRPAPDMLVVACRRLGVEPGEAVTFAHSVAGVTAGLTAGLAVVGVGAGVPAELLRRAGAERVVPALATLLDGRLGSPTAR